MFTKKLLGIIGVIVMALLFYIVIRSVTQEQTNGTLLNIKTSDYIRIWDGRTGESYIIDRKDYIYRIRKVVSELKYLKESDTPQAPGSGYNIFFEDGDETVLSHISYAWPEEIVYVNDVGYELVEEEKYLLYAYVADALYLEAWDDIHN